MYGKSAICLVLLGTATLAEAQSAIASLKQQGAYDSLKAAYEAAAYGVAPSENGTYQAQNARQQFSLHFEPQGVDVQSEQGKVALHLLGYPAPSQITATGSRIEYHRGALVEWYKNQASGIEQGFTFSQPPARAATGEPLSITLAVEGGWRLEVAEGSRSIRLRSSNGTQLQYAGLKAWDAHGRELPARMEAAAAQVRILVDDAGAAYPVTVDPVLQQAELTASDPGGNNSFGTAVAISGDTAVVGSFGNNLNTGAAYVFVRTGTSWTQQQELTPAGGTAGYNFGTSVAVSGNTVVVGAPGGLVPTFPPAVSSFPGAAYVFVRTGTTWTLQQQLTASDATNYGGFGTSVGVSGDNAVVGADTNGGGSAEPQGTYVFVRSGTTWTQQQKLSTTPGNDNFGFAVAVSGDTVVASNPFVNNGAGAAYVFVHVGNTWPPQTILTPSDTFAGDGFGNSVGVSGDTVVIGADQKNLSTGAAYVFVRSATLWTQQQELNSPLAFVDFAMSVAVDGNTLVAGTNSVNSSAGAVYLYLRSGATWNLQETLTASDASPGDRLGSSVAISGDTVLTGAYSKNFFAGAAYVFQTSTVAIQSSPAGRSFSVSGTGCTPGSYTAPQAFGFAAGWVPGAVCTVTFVSPDTSTPNTQYTLANWDDGPFANPRAITVPVSSAVTFYTAEFTSDFGLQTSAIPPAGGTVTGAGSYLSGTDATVTAIANPGYVFTGFTGSITAASSPQSVLMNSPQNVVANFAVVGPATLSALITNKAGAANARVWTVTLTNSGASPAMLAQINGVMLVQTFGTACIPVRINPATFPLGVGSLGTGASGSANATFDFSSCQATARFNATIIYTANGGGAGGATNLANQFQ